jgi:hypothetical protein
MDEYIKREALVHRLKSPYLFNITQRIFDIISEIPADDVAPVVHGRWIPHDRVFGDDFLVCSKCQFVSEDRSTRRYYHYCPHCGAKMDGGDNTER